MLVKRRNTPYCTSRCLYFILWACSLVVISCHSDEEWLEPVPYKVLNTIKSTTDITFAQVVKFLTTEEGITEEQIRPYKQRIDMAALRARNYKAYTITYHTTDPKGNPVLASGVVYYPKSGKPKGVIEALPYSKNKSDCPSNRLTNAEIIQGMAGFIVVAPDLIGFGETAAMPVPFFYHDNVAKVCADMRQAANELVRNEYGRDMPSWTMLSGISLSASGAWALARHYNLHPELGVKVSQIWIAGGAYNPLEVLDHQLASLYTDYVFLPSSLYSLNYYDELGLDFSKVFKGELASNYEQWCSGDTNLFDLSDKLGSDISQYLNLDFFSPDNPDYLRLRQSAAKLAVPNDWIPTCTIHIYHGSNDTYVPIESSNKLVEYLKSVGAKVDYVVTESGHVESCLMMGADLLEYLYK